MSHGPIENKHHEQMNVVAHLLDEIFAGYGFCLLVFEQNSNEGRMNYICNSRREDMLTAMKEFIANAEGRAHNSPPNLQ